MGKIFTPVQDNKDLAIICLDTATNEILLVLFYLALLSFIHEVNANIQLYE